MSEEFRDLVGKRISSLKRVHDYVQICFSDNSILNVFNDCSIVGSQNTQGCHVVAFQQDENAMHLSLSPEGTIIVGLQDDDFRGPEAMEYIRADGQIVIWR